MNVSNGVFARALNPVDKDQERITKKLRIQGEKLIWNDVKFPVNLNDIDKFEKHNVGISVNVFGYEGKKKNIFIH